MPHPTDLTPEGLFYEYYFDPGKQQACAELFCPSYASAISADPFSKQAERYLTVGLNSNLEAADFKRKKLNLVVVLDISGSMGSPFDRYFYDQGPEKARGPVLTKLGVATRSIAAMLDHLGPQDRFGMVLFDSEAYLARGLSPLREVSSLKAHIQSIAPQGSTDLSAGMELGTSLFEKAGGSSAAEWENRMVFLTDAMPNTGDTSRDGLTGQTRANAQRGIYTTFVGMGVDFNTALVEELTKVRGANYFAVHSPEEFQRHLDEEFDFMVTPLVFDLDLKLESQAYEIAAVYGSPEADAASGSLMHVNTLFPSRTENGETRGGVILLKLRPIGRPGDLVLRASYLDREGRRGQSETRVNFPSEVSEQFANSGIRKAVALARYFDLMQLWMNAERGGTKVRHEDGIPAARRQHNVGVRSWEQASDRLTVAGEWRESFGGFASHLEREMNAIGDPTLGQEVALLRRLARVESARRP